MTNTYRTKTFDDFNPTSLDKSIADFVRNTNLGTSEIKDIKYIYANAHYTAMMIYEIKKGLRN